MKKGSEEVFSRTANDPSTVKWLKKIWHFVASCIWPPVDHFLFYNFVLIIINLPFNEWNSEIASDRGVLNHGSGQGGSLDLENVKSFATIWREPSHLGWCKKLGGFFSGQQAVVDQSEGGRHLLASAVNLVSSSSSNRRWTWETFFVDELKWGRKLNSFGPSCTK